MSADGDFRRKTDDSDNKVGHEDNFMEKKGSTRR